MNNITNILNFIKSSLSGKNVSVLINYLVTNALLSATCSRLLEPDNFNFSGG